jgi:hypothetical protein
MEVTTASVGDSQSVTVGSLYCALKISQEKLRGAEWCAVALAACGTVGLGLTAEEAEEVAIDRRRALVTVGGSLVAIGACATHSVT